MFPSNMFFSALNLFLRSPLTRKQMFPKALIALLLGLTEMKVVTVIETTSYANMKCMQALQDSSKEAICEWLKLGKNTNTSNPVL